MKDKIELTEEMVNTLENPPKANNAFKAAAKKYKGEDIKMAEELKPCPFCGCKPEKKKVSLSEVYAYADKVTYLCKQCGCSRSAIGDSSKGGYADNSTTEARALANWNKRHNDTLTQQVAGLRAALQSVKLHQEKITPSGFEFSSVWQVANKAL